MATTQKNFTLHQALVWIAKRRSGNTLTEAQADSIARELEKAFDKSIRHCQMLNSKKDEYGDEMA